MSQRIVAKTVVSMPDIQLPDVTGLVGGMGIELADGFQLLPDMSSMSIFGGKSLATGNEFEGTFYSFCMAIDKVMIQRLSLVQLICRLLEDF